MADLAVYASFMYLSLYVVMTCSMTVTADVTTAWWELPVNEGEYNH